MNQGQDHTDGTRISLSTPKTAVLKQKARYIPAARLERLCTWNSPSGANSAARIRLYRFLADTIPVVNACIWTWVRLTAAPGRFVFPTDLGENRRAAAHKRLDELERRIFVSVSGARVGLATLIIELLTMLYRDGVCGGFVTVTPDGERVDRFLPIDPSDIRLDSEKGRVPLRLEVRDRSISLHRPDFYYIPLSDTVSRPLGRSILQPIPFVSYIEQQLIDDMRKASHNAGYHRLHVKITPPERMAGESDQAYTDRINSYFDTTVDMVAQCDTEDNPVTWDNVLIDYIGPDKSRDVTNSWFMNHRSMIEEICAGTNLAPFLLGYSYGATTTWADFKFDIVMRQVRSIQQQIGAMIEWLANIDLALGGLNTTCRYEFDNTMAYQMSQAADTEATRADTLLKLLEAGLIDRQTARDRAGRLI